MANCIDGSFTRLAYQPSCLVGIPSGNPEIKMDEDEPEKFLSLNEFIQLAEII